MWYRHEHNSSTTKDIIPSIFYLLYLQDAELFVVHVFSVLSKYEIGSQWKSYLIKYRVALEFYITQILGMENIPHTFTFTIFGTFEITSFYLVVNST